MTQTQSDAGHTPSASDIGRDVRLTMYRSMLELREFEQRAHDLFMQDLIAGTSHLALGQEAIAAAFGAAMRRDDWTFCTYRGHAHTLARGASMAAAMGELMGKDNGLTGGKGGSMHLTSVEHGAMGSYAIVGAHLPVAAGAAWSAVARGTDQVAVCFFGDGATNIGAFHEALNLAAVWKLPVVYVCENNLYMEYTPISAVTAVPRPAADRASAYGLDPILVDGNDADEMYRTAVDSLARARAGEGPSLIEAITYRKGGHSRADPGTTYRPKEEIEAWMRRDPIDRYRVVLLEVGVPEQELAEIERAAREAIDRATEEAKAAPPPGPEELERQVWYDGGAAWRN